MNLLVSVIQDVLLLSFIVLRILSKVTLLEDKFVLENTLNLKWCILQVLNIEYNIQNTLVNVHNKRSFVVSRRWYLVTNIA